MLCFRGMPVTPGGYLKISLNTQIFWACALLKGDKCALQKLPSGMYVDSFMARPPWWMVSFLSMPAARCFVSAYWHLYQSVCVRECVRSFTTLPLSLTVQQTQIVFCFYLLTCWINVCFTTKMAAFGVIFLKFCLENIQMQYLNVHRGYWLLCLLVLSTLPTKNSLPLANDISWRWYNASIVWLIKASDRSKIFAQCVLVRTWPNFLVLRFERLVPQAGLF